MKGVQYTDVSGATHQYSKKESVDNEKETAMKINITA